jgi:hypothetical protein
MEKGSHLELLNILSFILVDGIEHLPALLVGKNLLPFLVVRVDHGSHLLIEKPFRVFKVEETIPFQVVHGPNRLDILEYLFFLFDA